MPIRAIIWSVPLALCCALILGAYTMGRKNAGVGQSTPAIAAKPAEVVESTLDIERATQNQVTEQIKALEIENVRLKEELAFISSLLPTSAGAPGIAIKELEIKQTSPNQLHFRTLLIQGGGGKQKFTGNLQLAVTALQGGNVVSLTFPDDKQAAPDMFKIGFKHYQRLEGVLALPDGAIVKQVQVRIMDNGQLRTSKVIEVAEMK